MLLLSPLARLSDPELKNVALVLMSYSLSFIMDSRACGPGGLHVDATLNL